MAPQDNRSYGDEDAASTVHDQVLHGLLAAKEYERNRPRLPLTARRELIDANFPRVPEGDAASERPTEDECARLRFAMLGAASEEMNRGIANLREQLAEYHSLLDQLSSATAKCNALEKKCQERGCRIEALEWEVASLKQSLAARDSESGACRRVSMGCTATCGNRQRVPSFVPIQMQPATESGILDPNKACPIQVSCHSMSPVCDITPPTPGLVEQPNMNFFKEEGPVQVQWESTPVCDITSPPPLGLEQQSGMDFSDVASQGSLHCAATFTPIQMPPTAYSKTNQTNDDPTCQLECDSTSLICDITPPLGLDEPKAYFSDALIPPQPGQRHGVKAMNSLVSGGGIYRHTSPSSSFSAGVEGHWNKRSILELSDEHYYVNSHNRMAHYQQRDAKRIRSDAAIPKAA